MIASKGVMAATPIDLAWRLDTMRGKSVYAVYLVADDSVAQVLSELDAELRATDGDLEIDRLSSSDGQQLIVDLSTARAEAVLVDARPFTAGDWALLDRQRSSLARSGLLVFITTPSSFEALMRSAPNLSSFLGAEVFAYDDGQVELAAARERRLASLREWASKSDEEVIHAAEAGSLPPDPEYGEWLVLLGRGDLIASREA